MSSRSWAVAGNTDDGPLPVTSNADRRFGYRPDVDGLRAIAVVVVVLYHAGVPVISGGYVGVDIFFVISGFVIAGHIQNELAENRFSIAAFYERRIRRILPALAVTICASYFAFIGLMNQEQRQDLSLSLVASVFSVSNLYFWKTSGYFDPSAETRPLLHTWSLSVEEQFYLLIPLFMLLTWRVSPRLTKWLLALAAITSFALSVFMTGKAPTANFFMLPTRAWELLLGALIALTPSVVPTHRIVRSAMSIMGCVAIVCAVFFFNKQTPFPGLSAALPTVGTALLIVSGGQRDTVAARILASRPMVAIGLISYSLYLVHWPVFTFTRYMLLKDPGPTVIFLSCAISVILGFLSWRFVERPFRRPTAPVRRPILFAGASALLAGIAIIGMVGSLTTSRTAEPKEAAGALPADSVEWKAETCFMVHAPPTNWRLAECTRVAGAQTTALLWGDSFAAHYLPGLIRNASRLTANIVQYTSAGCPPLLDYRSYALPNCHGFNQKVFEVIQKSNATIVVLSARWDQLRSRGLVGLQETVKALTQRGLKVYVIGMSPIFAFTPDLLLHRKAGLTAPGEAGWEPSYSTFRVNETVRANAADATFIDPVKPLCSRGNCTYFHNGQLMFQDYGHLSEYGSEFAVRSYFPLYRADRMPRS